MMNQMIKDFKSIGIFKNLETKKNDAKDLKNLRGEIELKLHHLETSHDIWEDLKRFVNFLFWLENFQNEYRSKITDEDKIKRTFYVDTINRFFFHCMAHLHQFDSKLRIELSSKELSRERAVYLSLYLQEEIAKQELCEYFRSFGKNNQLQVSSIGDLIEELSEINYWPKLRLDQNSRISSDVKKEEIQNIKNELSIRISPQFNTATVINNTTNNNYHSCDNNFEQNEKLKEEKKVVAKTKFKSDKNVAHIEWQHLLRWFEDFFDIPFLKNNDVKKPEIKQLWEILQKKSYDGKLPKSIIYFFKNDMNRRVFLIFLKHISESQDNNAPIPDSSYSIFANRWSSNLKIENMKYDTVKNFLGNKECRDYLFNLKSYKENFHEIENSINELKSDQLRMEKTFHNNLLPFFTNILDICK